jgi:hypothetical protein
MAPVIVLIAVLFSLPWLTGQTFGQQCAKAFEVYSPAYERCLDRRSRGGSVHFEKNIVLTPAE